MKAKLLALLLAAATTVVAGSAQAVGIAGWNFSQYLGSGLLTTDGVGPATTLQANYSEQASGPLAPNVGPNGPVYGTMYYDGSFGSSNVEVTGDGTELFTTIPGSLLSNEWWPDPVLQGEGFNNTLADQINSGWTFATDIRAALNTNTGSTLSLVFEVDATDFAGPLGRLSNLELSLAGLTLEGNSNLLVQYSTDGSSYANVTTFQLTPLDTLFQTPLPNGALVERGFVRLTFQGTAGQVPSIDNVGIGGLVTVIPEPGTALLLGTGLVGLVTAGRRRSA